MYTRKVLALLCALYSCPAMSQQGINQPRRALRAGAARSFGNGQTTETRNWLSPVARHLQGDVTDGATGGSGSVTEGDSVSWDWTTDGATGEETTVGENSVFDPLEEPVPAQAPMPAASQDFSSSFGFDDQHAGGSGLPLDPAAAQADTPFSVSFVFDDDHAVGAAQVQSQIPDSSMTLPPVDTSAMWNIRLVIAGKRGITDLDETMLSARCTAFLTNLGYTGTCTFRWTDKTPSRRRLPWDTSRLLQAYTSDCGSDVYYTPVLLTGNAPLSYATAKAFVLGSDFASLFEGSNMYCGIKLWDFKTKVPELCCDTNVVVSLPKDSPLYYTITPTEAGTVTLSTCDAATNVDTALEVFTSDPLKDTTVLPAASNQDDIKCAVNAAFSSLSVTASAGQTLYVRVSGASTYGGTISITATCSVY